VLELYLMRACLSRFNLINSGKALSMNITHTFAASLKLRMSK
jgi:hypothetical protein